MVQKGTKQNQSMDPADKYSTAKKQFYGESTDHNTTQKKRQNQYLRQQIYERPPRRKNLNKQEIQRIYQNLLEQSQYSEAGKAQATIKYLNARQKTMRKRKISYQHSAQKEKLKHYHDREMKFFRQAWRQIFIQQSMKQRLMMQQIQRLRYKDQQQCKQRITKRCQSAKPVAVIAKLYQIQDNQRLLRKRGKTAQLRQIRKQKKKAIFQYKKQQQESLIKIAQQQKKRMIQKQTRRYKSFMHRIQQSKNDNERLYRRQQRKLKQKYQNMLKNMQHDQSRDLYVLERSINMNF